MPPSLLTPFTDLPGKHRQDQSSIYWAGTGGSFRKPHAANLVHWPIRAKGRPSADPCQGASPASDTHLYSRVGTTVAAVNWRRARAVVRRHRQAAAE